MRDGERVAVIGLVALFGALGLAGCQSILGIEDTRRVGDAGPDPGFDTQFVADSLILPADSGQSQQLAVDVDGKGGPDNAIGDLVASLNAAAGLNVAVFADTGVRDGRSITLANLRTTAFNTASDVTVSFLIGENPDPPPCANPDDITTCGMHLQGSATFDVRPAPFTAIAGELASGHFETDVPGEVVLPLVISSVGPPVDLHLIGARASFNVDASGATLTGLLGGGVPENEIQSSLVPTITARVMDTVARDCTGAPPDCCTGGSEGASLVSIFDANQDCSVTASEVEGNTLLQNGLAPDLDLLDGDGMFQPGGDGVEDSTSIGVGFSAVGASFAVP